MPQKRNPDPFELVRAKAASLHGCLVETIDLIRPLISGYHRDFQLTKAPIMRGLETVIGCLRVSDVCIAGLEVDADACRNAFTPELFATDRVLELARNGIPFRDAYRDVARSLEDTEMEDPVANIRGKTHLGATGNLGLEIARRDREMFNAELAAMLQRWQNATDALLTG